MARNDSKAKVVLSQDNDDEPDLIRGAFMKSTSRAQSVPPKPRNAFGGAKSAIKDSAAGAMDEDQFREGFSDYATVSASTGHEVETELMKINTILSSPTEDWEKRVEQLRRLRGVVVAGGTDFKEFQAAFRYLDLALQVCVKDLRSQVVRESCITLAYLAEHLEMKCERTAEMNLPGLLQLISNSVKIMATSGLVCVRMILNCVHSQKLVPIITREYLVSKSKEIRRACCEFVYIFLTRFPKSALDKHVGTIHEAIKKGISDADSDARSQARQAYFAFAGHFPAQANALYKELDAARQRMLDEAIPRSDSHSSLKSIGSTGPSVRPTATRPDNIGASRIPKFGQDEVEARSRGVEGKARSSSAIDMAAARRAKAKVLPATTARTLRPPTRTAAGPPLTRGRALPSQTYTKSQPGSRSNSPSSARCPPSSMARGTPQNGASHRDSSRDPSPSGHSALRNQSSYKSMIGRSGAGPGLRRPGGAGEISFSRKGSQDSSQYHSDDESETSSLGSEHSGLGRSHIASISLRDNLSDILPQLSSGNWTTKRDGLLALQRYMVRDCKPLSHSELEQICSIFTRMMNDPTTKVIGLFLDVLFDFVRIYKLELGSWVYTLMTKLLSKQGAELVPTVQSKIEKMFELTRSSFPTDIQFQHLVRFITDQTQTPNVRVKAAVLTYFITLIQVNMKPQDLKNSSSSRLGLTRIINWSTDGKTPEIRKSSQQVLVELKRLNEPEFNALLDTLDEFLHETASKLINGYPRRPSALLDETPRVFTTPQKAPISTVKSTSISRLSQERSAVTPLSSPSQISSGNEENLNPEAVLRNLRQTTQSMQKYANASPTASRGQTPRQRSEPPPSLSGSNEISPNYNDHSVVPVYASQQEQIQCLTTLADRIAAVTPEKQYTILRHLNAYLPLVSDDTWDEHFMTVLPFLYDNFQNPNPECVTWALACFGQMLRLQPERMRQYPELTLVNIIEVQKNPSKVVIKAADDCAYLAARVFPCEVSAKILVPIMNNQPHPENAAAVRLFTFMVQQATKEELLPILPLVVPSLISAYSENHESNMRKECVYALIHTQIKIGDDMMAQYVDKLPASKVRLMKLYLKRTVELGGDLSNVAVDANTTTKNGGGDTPL